MLFNIRMGELDPTIYMTSLVLHYPEGTSVLTSAIAYQCDEFFGDIIHNCETDPIGQPTDVEIRFKTEGETVKEVKDEGKRQAELLKVALGVDESVVVLGPYLHKYSLGMNQGPIIPAPQQLNGPGELLPFPDGPTAS